MYFGLLCRCYGFFAAGLLISSSPIEASLITFINRPAFEAATTGLTKIDFEGVVPKDSAQNFPNPAGLTTDGVTFRVSGTAPSGTGFVTVYGADFAAEQPAALNTGTGAIFGWAPLDQPGTAFLDVLLPTGKTAFATDVWTQQPFVATVQAVVNSGEATENFHIGTVDRPTPSFFGVTSDANTILLVRFIIPAGQVGLILDNVSTGTADGSTNPIAEPGTMILIFGGLVCVTVLPRRKHT
jgi:hypothetical protein